MGVMVKQSDLISRVKDLLRHVFQSQGELTEPARNGYWSLVRDAYQTESKIPSKYKHLMAVAAAVASRCRSSQQFHTEIARLQGATDEEIAEACAMGGVAVLDKLYFDAGIDYDELRRETLLTVEHRVPSPVHSVHPETGSGI